MDALVGGEVQGKVSVVDDIAGRFAGFESQDAGGEDLGDFADALGSRHGIRIQSVEQNETMRVAMPVLPVIYSRPRQVVSMRRPGHPGRESAPRVIPEHDDA